MSVEHEQVDCCIVGGGPAGLMLGLLLARTGVGVTLLEMHGDFDRDFRGDTVHASTLEVLAQIGLAEAVLALPHAKMRAVSLHTADRTFKLAEFSRLKSPFPYVAIMPQVAFLDLLCAQALMYPNFRCLKNAPVRSLLTQDGEVRGVTFAQDGETRTLQAKLTIGADGRFSRLRKFADLTSNKAAPPMDVCWLRLPRLASDGHETGAFYVGHGRMLVCLPRPDQWQIGYVFPKGDFKELRDLGLPAFRKAMVETAPWLGDRVNAINTWQDVHLLAVQADCLDRWYLPGLLLIGDAAHIMSPVGGVGINMAIADAVEAANVLATQFTGSGPRPEDLARVQRRRMFATRLTQSVQAQIQKNMITRALREEAFDLPLPLQLLLATPGLRTLPARIFGLGFPRSRLRAS